MTTAGTQTRSGRSFGHVLSLGWNQFEEDATEWLEEAKVVFNSHQYKQ